MRQRSRPILFAALLAIVVVTGMPATASAQWGPRWNVSVGVGFGYGGYYGHPYPYAGWYGYRPYWPYYYGGWAPYGPYPFYFSGYYPFGYPYYPYGVPDVLTSSVRLEVTPGVTEVYVDGYRAGSVDSYDGFFQRLRMKPGEHQLVLYLDGYRTVTQHLYLGNGADQKIHYTMVPLTAGETTDPRPQPRTESSDEPNVQVRPRSGPQGPRTPQGPPRTQAPAPSDARFGQVSIGVQPGDADVLVDGERWTGPSSQDRLVIQLSEGRHHVEIQKDGFEKYSGDVQVRRGETVTLNISLLRRDGLRETPREESESVSAARASGSGAQRAAMDRPREESESASAAARASGGGAPRAGNQ